MASWYGPGFAGLTTASGEPFDPSDYTAASKTLPFGTKLIVTYNGKSVVVRINDRGPYVAGRDLDLSQAAAEYIGLTAVGVAPVDVTYADPSTPTGPYTGEAAGGNTTGNTTGGNTTGSSTGGSTMGGSTTVGAPAPSSGASAPSEPSAAKDQYAASPRPSAQQYAATPPPPAPAPAPAPTPPAVVQHALQPPVPSPEALETPPPDLVKPDSTVRQMVVQHLAAPPAGFENLPERSTPTPPPAPRTTPQVEQSKAPAAPPAAKPQAEPQVRANAPVQVKPQVQTQVQPKAPVQPEKIVPVQQSSGSVQQKDGSGRGAPGITVLPDTGGAPLGALMFGSLALLSGLALVRRLRR